MIEEHSGLNNLEMKESMLIKEQGREIVKEKNEEEGNVT